MSEIQKINSVADLDAVKAKYEKTGQYEGLFCSVPLGLRFFQLCGSTDAGLRNRVLALHQSQAEPDGLHGIWK
jgi:hypothetical protein